MINSRALPVCVLASIVLCSAASLAQQAAPAVRILTPIDESQLVTLKGNTSPHANAKNDRGSVSPGLILPDLTLVLSRSPEQEAAFEAFISGQYDSSSPNYHQWLTPAEIGEQYGPAPGGHCNHYKLAHEPRIRNQEHRARPHDHPLQRRCRSGRKRLPHRDSQPLGERRPALREHERSADSHGARAGGRGRQAIAQLPAASSAQTSMARYSSIAKRDNGNVSQIPRQRALRQVRTNCRLPFLQPALAPPCLASTATTEATPTSKRT